MKRSGALQRRTRLRRTSRLLGGRALIKSRPTPRVALEGREAWVAPRWGHCAVCGTYGRIFRHHVLYERKIRDAGRLDLVYDLRNSLDIGAKETCACHHDHHRALRNGLPWRIPLPLVDDQALAFAVEVLGGDVQAAVWFGRYYDAELPEAA